MVKSKEGRPKNTVSCDDAEFFKVFLPDFNSHQLMIPPDFIKNFSRTIKEKLILKDIAGKIWHVDVERTRDGVFLKSGWQSFVSYHRLVVGEFLVFKYIGSYSFVVKIYGINGCKKETFAAKHMKVEEETEEEIEANQTLGLKETNEEVQNVASELPENCKEIERGDSSLPKSPYFVSLITLSKLYNVEIPKEVLNGHKLHLKPNMVLRNANGKEWPVRAYTTENGRAYIGKGWSEFRKDNNVGLRDSCRFIFGTERSSMITRVQILRAKSDMSHKKRQR